MRTPLAALAAMSLFAAAPALASASYQELLARPAPKPDAHIAYGRAAQQVGDLYLPKGYGAHPVVVLIHGGCWLGELPAGELMAPMVEPLRAKGFAVWNIDYRRLGQTGGGYPGTFLDAGAAVDELRTLAPRYHLDLAHVAVVGHSAGGHLAAWVAARGRIASPSPLHAANPLPVRGVVSLGGILDLEAYRAKGPGACGGPPIIDGLVGRRADPYADTSPVALLPSGVPIAVVSGGSDRIVPPAFGHDYAKRARAAGDTVTDIEIPTAGHFDEIDPEASAWAAVAAAIEKAAR
jgi:acetyl esterase/lipase